MISQCVTVSNSSFCCTLEYVYAESVVKGAYTRLKTHSRFPHYIVNYSPMNNVLHHKVICKQTKSEQLFGSLTVITYKNNKKPYQ